MFKNTAPDLANFASSIASWQRRAGRHGLPWQDSTDAYRIWLSEIMLQQTQVATVVQYYERFLERFPTVEALAAAGQDEVMPYWAGLGYYARARNLHRCAQQVCEHWKGRFPESVDDLVQLPGIGRSTASAIAAFAYGKRSPIMDGNVKRVFARYFGIEGDPSLRANEKIFWQTAETALDIAPPELDMTAYTQGLMDLGATICTRSRPACTRCPLASGCYAYQTGSQDRLPTRRPRKTPDQRPCVMLILEREGKILLEKRPSTGIWGGLLSLPQYDDIEAMESACLNWGLDVSQAQKMAGLSHAFSHFTLHIEPWLLQDASTKVAEPSVGHIWMPRQELSQAALPAPVSKLLMGLYQPAIFELAENG